MIEVYIFIVGLFFGSFLNVLADRLSQERSIGGRSECEQCHHTLQWKDLIPVISFILLKGRCRYCHNKFSIQYPLAELFTGVVFLYTWILTPFSGLESQLIIPFINLAIASCLIVIILSDLRYQIIPDEIQIALVICALLRLVIPEFSLQLLLDRFISGIIVLLPILLLFLATKGRGMGFADVKLSFTIGLLLGTIPGLFALYIGFLTGAIVGTFLLLTKKSKLKSKIAFGPFLVVGIYIMLFFQQPVMFFVRSVYGF